MGCTRLAWAATVAVCALLLWPMLARAHDGYEKWKQPPFPDRGCCNNYDCSPVEARFDDKRGIYQALIEGAWVDVPPAVILDPKKPENTNPDGGYHACWVPGGTRRLLCFREAEPKI